MTSSFSRSYPSHMDTSGWPFEDAVVWQASSVVPQESREWEDRMLATRVTAFFRSDPGERVHQARVIANGLASYDDANVGLTKLLEAASGAKVHDRVSLTADLLTLVDADVAQYVATSASPIWERRVGSDAILALLKAAARDGSAHSRMAIGRFAASDDVLNREAAVEAMADIEDDWSVRKLSERIELDPEPFIRELAVEYLGELLE